MSNRTIPLCGCLAANALATKLLLGVVLGCSSCHHAANGRNPASRQQTYVCVGAIRSADVLLSGELSTLLETNGIQWSADGSVIYDFYIREDKVARALEILRTNHLVLEGKVVLDAP